MQSLDQFTRELGLQGVQIFLAVRRLGFDWDARLTPQFKHLPLADDAQVLAVIDKQVKQRRESIEQYTAGGRAELAEAEQAEIDILSDFLPEQLGDDELAAMIDQAIADTGAASMADMGKVMGQLKPKVQGRADMKQVSAAVRSKLG
jgi:uncharacterized protein YqeY